MTRHGKGKASAVHPSSAAMSTPARGADAGPSRSTGGRREIEMDVKVHYALKDTSHSMSLRLDQRVRVPVYRLDGSGSALQAGDAHGAAQLARDGKSELLFAKVPLKTCLKAICSADPKMYPSETSDYIVKALKAADTVRQQHQAAGDASGSGSNGAHRTRARHSAVLDAPLLSPHSISRTASALVGLVRSPSKPPPIRRAQQADPSFGAGSPSNLGFGQSPSAMASSSAGAAGSAPSALGPIADARLDACGYLGCALADPDGAVELRSRKFKPKLVSGLCRPMRPGDDSDEDGDDAQGSDLDSDDEGMSEDEEDDASDDEEHAHAYSDGAEWQRRRPPHRCARPGRHLDSDADDEAMHAFASASELSDAALRRSSRGHSHSQRSPLSSSERQPRRRRAPRVRWVLDIVLRMEAAELDGMRLQERDAEMRSRREAQSAWEAKARRAEQAAAAGSANRSSRNGQYDKVRSSSIGLAHAHEDRWAESSKRSGKRRSSSPVAGAGRSSNRAQDYSDRERGRESEREHERQRRSSAKRQRTAEPIVQQHHQQEARAPPRTFVTDEQGRQSPAGPSRSRSLSPCEHARVQRSPSPRPPLDAAASASSNLVDTRASSVPLAAGPSRLSPLPDGGLNAQSVPADVSHAQMPLGARTASFSRTNSGSSTHLDPLLAPPHLQQQQDARRDSASRSPSSYNGSAESVTSSASASCDASAEPQPMAQMLSLLSALQSAASSKAASASGAAPTEDASQQQARTLLEQLSQSGLLQLLSDTASGRMDSSSSSRIASLQPPAGPSPAASAHSAPGAPSPTQQQLSQQARTPVAPLPLASASPVPQQTQHQQQYQQQEQHETGQQDQLQQQRQRDQQQSQQTAMAPPPAPMPAPAPAAARPAVPQVQAPPAAAVHKSVYHCYHCGREDPGTNAFWRKVEIADADWARLPPALIVKFPAAVKPGETPPPGMKVFVACKECGPAYNAWKETAGKAEPPAASPAPATAPSPALSSHAMPPPPPPAPAPARHHQQQPSRTAHNAGPRTSPVAQTRPTFEPARNMTQSSPAPRQPRLDLANSSPATARNQILNDDGMDYGGDHSLPLNATPGTILAGLQDWTPLRRSPRKQPAGTQVDVNPYATAPGDGSPMLPSKRAPVSQGNSSSPPVAQGSDSTQFRTGPRQSSITSPEGQTPGRLEKALTNWSDSDDEGRAVDDDAPDASPSPARRKAADVQVEATAHSAPAQQLTKGPRQRLASKPMGPFMGRSPSVGAEGILSQQRLQGLRHVVSSPSKGHDDRDMDPGRLFSNAQEISASSPSMLDFSWMNTLPATDHQTSPSKFLASLGIQVPPPQKTQRSSLHPDAALGTGRRPLPATVEDASSSVASSPADAGQTPDGVMSQLFDEYGLLPASGIGIPGSTFDPSNIHNIETYGAFAFDTQFNAFTQHNTPGFAAHVPPKQQQPAVVMQGPSFEQGRLHSVAQEQPLAASQQDAAPQPSSSSSKPAETRPQARAPSKKADKRSSSSKDKEKGKKKSRSKLQAVLAKLPQEMQLQANSLIASSSNSSKQSAPPPAAPAQRKQTVAPNALPDNDITAQLLNLLKDPQMQAAILGQAER